MRLLCLFSLLYSGYSGSKLHAGSKLYMAIINMDRVACVTLRTYAYLIKLIKLLPVGDKRKQRNSFTAHNENVMKVRITSSLGLVELLLGLSRFDLFSS